MNNIINIYADGGNRNTGVQKGNHVNPDDLSAWAFLIENENTDANISSSGFVLGATNNAMEITAVAYAFKYILENIDWHDSKINLILDSKYVLDSLQKGWLDGWIKKNDVNRPNFDIWQSLYPMFEELRNNIEYQWVKGHDSNPGNLFVDDLLNKTMDNNAK